MPPQGTKTTAGATKDMEENDVKPKSGAATSNPEDQTDVDGKKDSNTVEDGEEPELPKEPEAPAELEQNAPPISGARVKAEAVTFSPNDCTMNFMPMAEGRLCSSLGDGGMQYLLAGARATAGVKAGRYMFEIKIVEILTPPDVQGSGNRTFGPKNHVKVGVSLTGSSLFLGDDADSVGFDSEGLFIRGKHRSKVSMTGVPSSKFARDQVVGLLVNLDQTSPNANTVSLFRNGLRVSAPQAIPEHMVGKPLFPTITYKNVTLQINFGPTAEVALPFSCHLVGAAAAADIDIKSAATPPGGKHNVVFPVGLPDQGFFDWVDLFLEKNPDYTELSDRKILDWAAKSGLWKGKKDQGSADKPEMKFGIPQMDDQSVKRVLMAIAPSLKRNFIIPELRSNLVEGDRKKTLAKFWPAHFKRTATVVMGAPSSDYKQKVQGLILVDKQAQADAEKKKKQAEEQRKRQLLEKQKKAEAAKKAREASQRKKEGKEDLDEAAAQEEDPDEAKQEDAAMEDPPVELNDEEKKLVHRKRDTPDISEQVLAKSYASFTLPSKAEGFDEVNFAWEEDAACSKVLRSWMLQKKMTSRAEDLQPGAWFKEEWQKFQKEVQTWRKRQTEHKDPVKRKAYMAKKQELAKQKREEDEQDAGGASDAKESEEEMKIDVDELNVSAVADVTDIGNGEPLFANFKPEDWILLNTRYEFHLLLHSFKKDLNDPDRPSFGDAHVAYYYSKYFRRNFSLQSFGMSKFADFVELIKDSVGTLEDTNMLKPVLPEDTALDTFVKLTEEHRRDRQRRLDAGDESAEVKISRPAPQPPSHAPHAAPVRPGLYNSGNAPAGRGAPMAAGGVKRVYSPAPRAPAAPGPVHGPPTKTPRVWQQARPVYGRR